MGLLKIGHRSADCTLQKKCMVDSACDKYHYESLHQAHVHRINFHAAAVIEQTKDSLSDSCLSQITTVSSGTSPSIGLNILWDGRTTISLITFKKANEKGPVRDLIKMAITKVGGEKQEHSSYIYDLAVMDKDGKIVHFQVYGIDCISTEVIRKNLETDKGLFKNFSRHAIKKPTGEIDVFIGFQYTGFHPVREHLSDHLFEIANRFRKCIGGSHSLLKENTEDCSTCCRSSPQ